jgi:putative endonuclease
MLGPFFMWHVYVLYSMSSQKTYVGFTKDVNRRLFEHNVSETKGFTLRYRPWTLIYTESFASKEEAMKREKFLKTGRGREELKQYVLEYLNTGAVSAAAEKD